jgi:uncharacterized protein YndB with AHSA1/START domain
VVRGDDDLVAEIPTHVDHTVAIAATPTAVWRALTEPALMRQWMGEPEMQLDIDADWRAGGPFVVRGFHHVRFENRGTVRTFEPERTLEYTQLSSVSRLPDVPESYCVLSFALAPQGDGTSLTLTLRDFPTHTIYKHLDFYWRTTLEILKQLVERNDGSSRPSNND